MPALTWTDQRILAAAADRADATLLPLPEGLRLHGAARRRVLAKLQALGLAAERQAGELHLTADGYRGAGRDDGASAISPPDVTPPSALPRDVPLGLSSAPRPDSKLALVIDVLCHRGGVTLDELVAATGWQPHTVRATLTHLRRRGMTITRRKSSAGRTFYQAATGPEPEPVEARPETAA